MKKVTVTRYQAVDGTEFATEEECKNYEQTLALETFFTSLDVYGVGVGFRGKQIDLGFLCKKVLENSKTLKAILDD